MTIKRQEFDRIVAKFGLTTRQSGDLLAWLEVDGKVVVRTKRSNKKGDLPMQDSVRQQLKLNQQQLKEAIDCSLSKDDYIQILKDKRII